MMINLPKFLLAVLISLFALFDLGGANEFSRIVTNSQRPANSIFDPTGVLTAEQQEEISEPLQRLLEVEGIDVLVVILPDLGESPREHVAKSFAEKWSMRKVSSVVLYVPGEEGSPWIFLGKEVALAVKTEVVQKSILEGEKRAGAEPDDFGKVRAASNEAADAVRYWIGGALLQNEKSINTRLRKQLDLERRNSLYKLAAAFGVAALIPVFFGVGVIISRFKKMGPRVFPSLRKIERLGAPYSGGNSVVNRN